MQQKTGIVSRDESLIPVWLHELQDRANVIASMGANDVPERFRCSFYEGLACGLNDDHNWREIKQKRLDDNLVVDQEDRAMHLANVLGFKVGAEFKARLESDALPSRRLKRYEHLRDRMEKIHPWSDQTKKPL